MDNMSREYTKEKRYKSKKSESLKYWNRFEIDEKIQLHILTHFNYKKFSYTDSKTKEIDLSLAIFSEALLFRKQNLKTCIV